METVVSFPTPYPDVNETLDLLLANVREILRDHFVGMYLYGSLATGDFDPQTSDIDFLVVTADTLPPEKITELERMHRQIWDGRMKWADKIEGSYVHRGLIRRHDPDGAPCPTVNEGEFFVDKRGSDWIIQRHVIRECGVTLAGPDPRSLIDPVSPDAIRDAVRGVLQEWWFPMLQESSWLAERGSEYHAYAILTMCRALYALEHGTILSKPAAARWAQARLDEGWCDPIARALAVQQHGNREADLLSDALDFIRCTKETLEV
jgi:predicted nucleotidyltransferase